ncbi:MAG: patatin-like phospholipase family protein [Xenococcus sp. (in: cyanobacteria)]|nr:patatin-like phospholipase family protein [Xenococcaceae cyanobacterium MO_167.B52]
MTYKILSLDGGGFRGVISARIIKAFEEKLKEKKLHEYFDLVTGTSTGSLIAAGIAKGKSADDLLKLYKDNGPEIFPDHIRRRRRLLQITRGIFPVALYPHNGLGDILSKEEIFGSTKIREITKPVLLIPAYNTSKRELVWFCSNNPESHPRWYDDIEVWKICVCSASAPTFFPPYQLEEEGEKKPFVDGGIAANNPALLAIAHAMLLPYNEQPQPSKQLKLDDIAIVSIGTGIPTKGYSYEEVKGWGMFGWAKHLGDIFLPAPNDVNANICWQIIRGGNDENAKRVLRLDCEIKDDKLETIDNPHLYDGFVKVAENYLDEGKARIGIHKHINPIEAIEHFINNNP